MDTQDKTPAPLARILILATIFAAGLAVLLVRLWVVQVRQGPEHNRAIADQSLRLLRINPVRGRIRAAGGQILVDNRPCYNLVFHVSEMRRPGLRHHTVDYIYDRARFLAQRLGRHLSLTKAGIEDHLKKYPGMPLLVFQDLASPELVLASELWPPIRGMEIVCDFRRRYPYPGLASHILGFTGRRRPPLKGLFGRYRYSPRLLVGRSGLEKFYDKELTGSPGTRVVLIDSLGYVHRSLSVPAPPVNGDDLELTLDLRAQRSAQRALTGVRGALVAVDIHRGAVLAMASSPSFDLASLSAAMYAHLRRDTARKPLLNRALAAGYQPGSIVKPLVALASLNAGAVTAKDIIVCPGWYELGKHRIYCWDRYGHGPLDLVEAIEQSCNVFFITIGLRTGLEHLEPVFRAAGIGQDPEIDLPHSPKNAAGTLPDRQLLFQRAKRRWSVADTAYVAIGQGPISLSPLQAALYTAAIANGGLYYRPYLVQKVLAPDGRVLRNTVPRVLHRLPGKPEHFALVRKGMWMVVNGPKATADRARTPVISLAGKTGTAEVGNGRHKKKNCWFVCFGPWEDPEYAVAVLVEDGRSGGHTAAPVARRFFEGWLTAAPARRP